MKISEKDTKTFNDMDVIVYSNPAPKREGYVVNFFRLTFQHADDHIGYIETDSLNDIVEKFKEKYPEETL